jgi:hypothetical protein
MFIPSKYRFEFGLRFAEWSTVRIGEVALLQRQFVALRERNVSEWKRLFYLLERGLSLSTGG